MTAWPASRRALAIVVLAALPAWPGVALGQGKGQIAAELERLGGAAWIERSVSLRDLGILNPESLAGIDARREYYVPVPPAVTLSNASLQVDAGYYRGDGGTTNLILSIDGYPVARKPADKESGDIQFQVGVDGAGRPGGQLRLGLRWSSQVPVEFCMEPRADANVLRLQPTTRLAYRFNGSLVRTLNVALGALSPQPVVAIAPAPLADAVYGAAAVVGLALDQANRKAVFRPLPAVGSEVDTARLVIPPALRALPAFAGLAGGARKALQSPREVAAYLMLADTAAVEIALDDVALLKPVQAAFDALAAEFRAAGPDAAAAFDAYRQAAWSLSLPQQPGASLRLVTAAGRPVVMVASADANQAAATMTHALRGLLIDRQVKTVATQTGALNITPLTDAGVASTFSVLAAGDWVTSFPIGRVSREGELPVKLIADVAAAPSAGGTRPVASVFFNDVLIGARQLVADGSPESIDAEIPRYALGGDNRVRVLVQRQPASDRCREVPQAFPVSVLPTSRIVLANASPLNDFAGMAARFAQGSQLLYPGDYRARPEESLPVLVRLAAAVGMAPQNLRLTVVAPSSSAPLPDLPFLAVDLPAGSAADLAGRGNGRIVVDAGTAGRADWQSLNRIGEFRVGQLGHRPGVIYRAVGPQAAVLAQPVRLSRGDWAYIDSQGVVASGSSPGLYDANDTGLLRRWSTTTQWMLGTLATVVVLLLIGAVWVGRRRKSGRTP